MRMIFAILFAGTIGTVLAQTGEQGGFEFNPPGLHVAPLRANSEEPRVGVSKFTDAAEMRVDVGNSIDIVSWEDPSSGIRVTAGIDFMAYALTTGAEGLRLQIDAIDGLFGGNLSFSKTDGDQSLIARLRILHHSAHFVDGHYDAETDSWINNQSPIPYTRDFGELVLAWLSRGDLVFRPYAGMRYSTLTRPAELQRFTYLAGLELSHNIGQMLDKPLNLYFAYNISWMGSPEYRASQQMQAGMKFGDMYGKGPSLYVAYYDGQDMFGEYYAESVSHIGIGFTVDFF